MEELRMKTIVSLAFPRQTNDPHLNLIHKIRENTSQEFQVNVKETGISSKFVQ